MNGQALVAGPAHVAGSDALEKSEVRVGFVALTDCAPVVMAAAKGFDAKYGIRIVPTRASSWASIRDQLMAGDLDAAQILYGLVYGLELGIGGPQQEMAVLMTLNQNGQGISLASQLREQGVTDGEALADLVARHPAGSFAFAQTFPTGTHALWLNYWLAAHGIDPLRDVRTISVPPPQMVLTCRLGRMHGFCVGEPWNQRGIADGVSFSVASSQDVWPDHPEKVLGTTAAWVAEYPNTARALTAALLEASRWIDASPSNKRQTAEVLAGRDFVDTDVEVIAGRMLGHYQDGLGRTWEDSHPMAFFADGAVNFPYLSDAMWFMTQHRRWGMLKHDPDYLAVARKVNRIDVYAQAAAAAGVGLPASEMRSHRLMDGHVWDGSNPAAYAASFRIRAHSAMAQPA